MHDLSHVLSRRVERGGQTMGRTKVAVLGGGMSGLTAALELTATPELRERNEVTVYQLGWRLGGKCATGRDLEVADRVQEHGLHLWFGGYENAFGMLRRCFDELDRPEGNPIRSIADAFAPLDAGVLYDDYGDHWSFTLNDMPPNSDRPGEDHPEPIIFDVIANAVHQVERLIDPHTSTSHAPVQRHHLLHAPAWLTDHLGALQHPLRWFGEAAESALLHGAAAVAEHQRRSGEGLGHGATAVSWMLKEFRAWLWEHHGKGKLDDDAVRHAFTKADTFLTIVIGVLDDDLIGDGFGSINDRDFRSWLTSHGAQPVTLTGPLVRSFYSQVFAVNLGPTVLDLDRGVVWNSADHPGELAAGATALIALGEYLAYRGSVLWKPTAGFAEAVVTPIFDVLRARGVTFEFFCRVDSLDLAPDRLTIDSIAFTRQVATVGDAAYQPTVTVHSIDCWPSEPFWNQLQGEPRGIDFERGEVDPATATPGTLVRGDDFDVAVLAISAAALPAICRQLLADDRNPRFTTMLANTHTVMTQAFQVWSNRSAEQLGWYHAEAVASSFIEPLDTYCDMSQLTDVESWQQADDVHSIGYFCGVLEDTADDSPAAANQRARDGALDYLGSHIATQWPGSVDPATGSFDWSVLVDRRDRSGPARLDAQFVRANYELTERYVQTPPNSVAYRLKPDESGYANLILAGDWTDNGLNVGSVEAAVISGMLASRAICGSPVHFAREGELY
jgi:uncharacterized protein with NAD-binding domain and iron-sulfur cluster